MKTTIELAREARLGAVLTHDGGEPRVWIEGADWHTEIQHFDELARADERAKLLGASVEPTHYQVSAPITRGVWNFVPKDSYAEYTINGWKGRELYTAEALAARVAQAQAEQAAEIERLTQDRDEWKESTIMANDNARREEQRRRDMQEERDTLRTENEALRLDAKRYLLIGTESAKDYPTISVTVWGDGGNPHAGHRVTSKNELDTVCDTSMRPEVIK